MDEQAQPNALVPPEDWPSFQRRVVPHRVTFVFYLSEPERIILPEMDDVDDEDEWDESLWDEDDDILLYFRRVEENVFEGWNPPVPFEGDIIEFAMDGEPMSGTVDSVATRYTDNGIEYSIRVRNSSIVADEEESDGEEASE